MSTALALASPLIALALVLALQVIEEWAIGASGRRPRVLPSRTTDPEEETTDEESREVDHR